MSEHQGHVHVDFNSHVCKAEAKGSHLHKLKPIPNPNGNRAERRAAKKLKRRISE